jgi:hypothetical protein
VEDNTHWLTSLLAIIRPAGAKHVSPWISFDTFYPNKSIYYFRNTGDLEFDTFTDRLRDAIISSDGPCGLECNPE